MGECSAYPTVTHHPIVTHHSTTPPPHHPPPHQYMMKLSEDASSTSEVVTKRQLTQLVIAVHGEAESARELELLLSNLSDDGETDIDGFKVDFYV